MSRLSATWIEEDRLTHEAVIAMQRGLPTVRAADWNGHRMVEKTQPLVEAVAGLMRDDEGPLAALLVAALRTDAGPDALKAFRKALASAHAELQASDIVTAQRHEAEEMEGRARYG